MNEISRVIEVALSQAPEVSNQILILERMDCVGWFVVCLVAAYILYRLWSIECEDEFSFILRGAVFVVGCLVGIGLIANPINFLATIYAPNAVVIERLSREIRR